MIISLIFFSLHLFCSVTKIGNSLLEIVVVHIADLCCCSSSPNNCFWVVKPDDEFGVSLQFFSIFAAATAAAEEIRVLLLPETAAESAASRQTLQICGWDSHLTSFFLGAGNVALKQNIIFCPRRHKKTAHILWETHYTSVRTQCMIAAHHLL